MTTPTPSIGLTQIERLTDVELRAKYDEVLIHAQQIGSPEPLVWAELYKNELNARAERKRHRREDIIEYLIVGLISLELVVGLWTLHQTKEEFRIQTSQFKQQSNDQADQFARQMKILDTQLVVLQNLNTISTKSVTILGEEQRHRKDIESAKPRLVLYLDGKPLLPGGAPGFKHPIRSGHTVEFQLMNTGTAPATEINIVVRGADGIRDISCNNEGFRVYHEQIMESEHWGTVVKIAVPETLAKKGTINLSLSFIPSMEEGANIGLVYFEAQTKENPAWVGLASVRILLRV